MSSPAGREQLPDALRAIAMVAVLVVNAIGYAAAPWGAMLGERTPADSPWAAAAQGLVGALLQGKGIAMLAFVFGMSLWLAARRRNPAEARRRGAVRQRRLLVLGVLHGAFVYFGDILTLYALTGWLLLRQLLRPGAALLRHLRRVLVFAVVVKLAWVGVLVGWPSGPVPVGVPTIGTVAGLASFVQLNADAYLFAQAFTIVFAGPLIYLCMVGGVVAARLRLLTHRRWRPHLRAWLGRIGPPLLLLTAVYGVGVAWTEPQHPLRPWIDTLGDLAALPLAACYLMALALAADGGRARWCRWLAPLGQRTLTLYLGHSLVCMVVLSGAGWGMPWTTVQVVGFSLGLWLLAWVAAWCSGSRRWPMEAWMARR